MKTKFLLFAISILLSVKSFSQNYLWAKQQDGGGNDNEKAYSVTTDDNGNVIVVGTFSSPTITFGTTTLTNAGSYQDVFIVKYDPNGNVLWAKQQDGGGDSDEAVTSVTADANGNIIVTGGFYSQSIIFGTTTLTNTDTNSVVADFFIVKYAPNGNVLWAKGGGGTSQDYGSSVATDDSGNIILGGRFTFPVTFGTTTFLADYIVNGGCIVKYNPNGDVLWAKRLDGQSTDISSVVADQMGNIIATGTYGDTLTFGTTTLPPAGSYDIFIVKYDPNGNELWAKHPDGGGSSMDFAKSVATDDNGNVIVAGYFKSPTLTFGTTTLTNAGTDNIFIVKYDLNGNVLWAKQQDGGGTQTDAIHSVTTDTNENIIVAGETFSPTITFGTTTLTTGGGRDFFIVKYDLNGNVLWAKKQEGDITFGMEFATSTATDADGNIFVTGAFTSPTFTFGTTILSSNSSDLDMFVVKLSGGGATGIKENTLNNEPSSYPNPTAGLIFLPSYYNVTLTDLTGKIIAKELNTNTIDISNQPAGMYFLLLANNKGQIVQRSKVTKE